MKKNYLFIFIALFLAFLYPANTYALTNQTSFVDINNIEDVEVGSLSFSNISFRNYSLTSAQAFGLTGTVFNSSNSEVNYVSTVSYYDSSHNLIAEGTNSQTIMSGTSSFNQMSNLSILGNHKVDEIRYYRLSINISDYSYSDINDNLLNNTPSKNYQYSSYDYVIDKYDVNIIVNENNTLDITETITAYFNFSKHGIIRTIPLKNTITRLDGTTSTNRTQIKNVSVNKEYSAVKENGNYKLKIGSSDYTVTGKQNYIIKYTYNLGKDPIKNYDELYYNIIGNEWDTVIGDVTFSVTMPKEFDSSKLGFSSGKRGSTDNSRIKYNVSENKITGSYSGILSAGEGITIRCELPEGYFVGAKLDVNIIDYIMFLFPILFLLISIFLWYKFGRDDQVIETVEFYPPEGLNSLDVGFIFKGQAENKDVTSLLIFLANKGYLKITDNKIGIDGEKVNLNESAKDSANRKVVELQNKLNEEKKINPNSKKIKYLENMIDVYKNIDTPIDYKKYGLTSSINKLNNKNKFLIKKLKDYDGTDINEQWFIEGLFEYNRTEVTDKTLYNSFYVTNNRILHNINDKQNKDKIFEKSASNKKILIVLMIIASYCLITIPPILNFGEIDTLVFALLFPIIGFSVLFAVLFQSGSFVEKLFGIIWGLGFGGMPWIAMVLPALKQDITYIIASLIGIICIVGMIICLIYLPKRTKYGREMLGKLKGFKKFLETAEKEKLEAMVQDNPNYFYDILPFTYVLGISDKWIKKFESISLQSPSWYSSSNSFDFSNFETFVKNTMNSAQRVMTSSPSSSSSGGSSGGGSSGGGSGGGGGSSW